VSAWYASVTSQRTYTQIIHSGWHRKHEQRVGQLKYGTRACVYMRMYICAHRRGAYHAFPFTEDYYRSTQCRAARTTSDRPALRVVSRRYRLCERCNGRAVIAINENHAILTRPSCRSIVGTWTWRPRTGNYITIIISLY